jgi:hypothetical protein
MMVVVNGAGSDGGANVIDEGGGVVSGERLMGDETDDTLGEGGASEQGDGERNVSGR